MLNSEAIVIFRFLNVSWSILSFFWSVSILCSNLELSAECLTCWARHLKLLTRSSLSLLPAVFSSPWLLFPSSFTLLFSCVLRNPLPNLCFRPLRLAPGKANKPSFSVFCCKYSHSWCSPCHAHWLALVVGSTEARDAFLQEHMKGK